MHYKLIPLLDSDFIYARQSYSCYSFVFFPSNDLNIIVLYPVDFY